MSSGTGKIPFSRRLMLLPLTLMIGPPLFLILGAIGLLVSGYVYAGLALKAFSLKRRMARNQRLISTKILEAKLASGAKPGTFILEGYTLGWGVGRVWWTPDLIPTNQNALTASEKVSKLEEETDPHELWIYDTYANLKGGKALLLVAWSGKHTLTGLQRLFPSIPTIKVWSGAIEMKRHIELRKLEQGNRDKGTDPSTSSG